MDELNNLNEIISSKGNYMLVKYFIFT